MNLSTVFWACAIVALCGFQIGTTSAQDEPKAVEKVLMCYWGYWSVGGPANFSIETFDANLCTHLIFSFAGVRPSDSSVIDLDFSSPAYYKMMVDKKKENPKLKALLAIGGWNEGSEVFSVLAADENRRKAFVDSAIALMRRYAFDGIDMDWEFPAHEGQGGKPEDKENFVTLLKDLREGLDAFNKTYLLTAAVGTGPFIVDPAYDVGGINKYVNYFHLMAYDLRGYFNTNSVIGHHAPLFPSVRDAAAKDPLNLKDIVDDYITKGADRAKLVLGVGTYGKTYTLISRAQHNFFDNAYAAGPRGPFTDAEGTLSYAEICYEVPRSASQWEFHFDEVQQIPYAFNDTVWVGYDDERSAIEKTNFAMEEDLGGMMIWSIEQDDCNNYCGGWYKCPIITAIRNRLDEENAKLGLV